MSWTELWSQCLYPQLQVQYSQRNLPANTQRKYLQSTYIPKGYSGEYALTPSFPLELKDIQLLSVSPSGTDLDM